jgi:AraC-like DNA-binding protein
MKNYKKSQYYFNRVLSIAVKIQANELIKEAYQGLYLVNKEIGNPDSSLRYLSLYHQLNDSIYSQESKNKIAELQNKYEFEKKEQAIILLEAEQELKDNKLRNSRIWLFVLIGGITISLFFLGLIYFQMTRKKRANIELVRKNKEIVKSEEYFRECLKSEQQNKHVALKQNKERKYAGSPLTEDYKEDLKLLITNTIENEKLYLKSDFTIAMLSKHLDVSRTYISQVINEKYKMNFISFVNEFRINEARRMLLDESNKNFTIEAIGSMLGFRSKTSFYAAFRKHTGVTPSIFMKYLD